MFNPWQPWVNYPCAVYVRVSLQVYFVINFATKVTVNLSRNLVIKAVSKYNAILCYISIYIPQIHHALKILFLYTRFDFFFFFFPIQFLNKMQSSFLYFYLLARIDYSLSFVNCQRKLSFHISFSYFVRFSTKSWFKLYKLIKLIKS